jgi:hypothetical protein
MDSKYLYQRHLFWVFDSQHAKCPGERECQGHPVRMEATATLAVGTPGSARVCEVRLAHPQRILANERPMPSISMFDLHKPDWRMGTSESSQFLQPDNQYDHQKFYDAS